MNRPKSLAGIVLAVILLVGAELDSYAQLGSLHFGSYRITSILPRSFRSVDGELQVECSNRGQAFVMSDIEGVVYKLGRPFVSGHAGPVTVGKGKTTVVVDGNATLCEGISLWDVLECLAFNASDYTIDVSMTITMADGRSRHFSRKGMSVAAILRNVRSHK